MTAGYPSDWETRRKKVYRRDNYTCQNCGAVGGSSGDSELHAHHIVPKSKGGTHEISNLKTLCRGCHQAIHGDVMAPSKEADFNPQGEETYTIPSGGEDGLTAEVTKEELISEGQFTYCPICHSQEIGVGSGQYTVKCQDCGLKLSRERFGLSVDDINLELIDEESPFSRIEGHTLAAPAWMIISDLDNDVDVDLDHLERQSQKFTQVMEKIRNSKVPAAVFVIMWLALLIALNYLLPPILGWGGALTALIGFAILLAKKNSSIKLLIFKNVV